MNETPISKALGKAIIKEFGVDSWGYKTSDRYQKGIPDRILCLKGKFIGIEVKDPKRKRDSKSRAMQEYNITRINQAGGVGFFAESCEEAMVKLRQIYATL